MTVKELETFLEHNNNSIEWYDDEENRRFCFRNVRLPWYRNDFSRSTAVAYWKLDSMSPDDLMHEINRGLEIEGITRITGYFTKVSGWNPGKRAELKDRMKSRL